MNKILSEQEISFVRKIREKLDPSCVIAGGSVRDMVFNKPYRDVDIYLGIEPVLFGRYHYAYFVDEFLPELFNLSSEDHYADLADILSQKNQIFGENVFASEYGIGNKIDRIFEIQKDGTKYQIILIKEKNVSQFIDDTFDLNTSKIYHDGYKVYSLSEFDQFKNSLVINCKADSRYISKQTIERAQRLKQKYPEWKLSKKLENRIKNLEKHPQKAQYSMSTFEKYQQMLGQQAQATQHIAPVFAHTQHLQHIAGLANAAEHQGQPITTTITGNPMSYEQAHLGAPHPIEYAPDPVDDYNAIWGMTPEEEPPQ